MNRNDAFPSKYLRAADIPDEGRVFTIKDVEEEDFKNDGETETKIIVYFRESEKGLILNKTNGNTFFDLCGEDTDDWPGKKVRLLSSITTFQGKPTPCIRVSTKAVATKKAAPAAVPVITQNDVEAAEGDDDIPF